MVETAIVLPLVLLLIFGIVDFGRAYNAKQTLTHATREAVRVYTVTEDPDETAAAFDAAVISLGEGSGVTLNLDPSGGCDPGDPVTATATYSFDFLLLPFGTISMDSKAVMRCGG
jgi:Flp pilus assembly protein TadG